mgnify:CR=1 FL=1
MSDIKKIVLAYSGGLDTSVILKWLQETYQCEVVTFTADLGQGDELEPAKEKAKAAGVKEIFIEDLKEEFVRDFVFPMFRANAVYEGEYLLGTSIARPLIAKRLIELAKKTNADAIAELSFRNFMEMSSKTADAKFLLQKKIEKWFSDKHPDKWMPLYSRVTFSLQPYSEALAIGDFQNQIVEQVMQLKKIEKKWNSQEVEDLIIKLLK